MEKVCKHKECECKYKEKCNVAKIIIVAGISFFVVCGIMLFILFQYHKKVNTNFQSYISKTTEIISNIKVENQKNKQVILSDELSKAISKVNQGEYENFLHSYYETQNNWLNMWLTILALLLGFFGLVIPLCFLKFYEAKKEEFDIVIADCKEEREKMSKEVAEVKERKESMTADLEAVKQYVEEAKKSEERTRNNQKLVAAMREASSHNYEEGLLLVNQVLQVTPHNIVALGLKGDLLKNLNRYEEAADIYKEILKTHKILGVYNNYGNVLCELNKLDQAIDVFSNALKIRPADYRILSNRGVAFIDKGMPEKAIQDLEKALQNVPDDKDSSEVLYNLTESYLSVKMFKKALSTLEKMFSSTQEPTIFDDDKPKWLKCLQDDLDKLEVVKILELINKLKIQKRK